MLHDALNSAQVCNCSAGFESKVTPAMPCFDYRNDQVLKYHSLKTKMEACCVLLSVEVAMLITAFESQQKDNHARCHSELCGNC